VTFSFGLKIGFLFAHRDILVLNSVITD